MTIRYVFNSDGAIFPSGSFPELSQVEMGGSLYQRVLAFDDTDIERVLFSAPAASGWSGSITASVFSRADSGTSGSVVWELSIDGFSPGDSINGSTFATAASGIAGTTAGGSALQVTEISPDDDGIAAGDLMMFLLRRNTGHASDTMTGDCYFTQLVVADGG